MTVSRGRFFRNAKIRGELGPGGPFFDSPIPRIAKKYGLSVSSVYRIESEHRNAKKKWEAAMKSPRWRVLRNAAIRREWRGGAPARVLAHEYGLCLASIYRIVAWRGR